VQYLVPLIVFVVLALLVWLAMRVQQGMERSFVLLFRRRYDFEMRGSSAEHLAEEIVAHTGHEHPHMTTEMSAVELTEHRARLLNRIEDMLAGGPGTPV
jgi:hypothetical protein